MGKILVTLVFILSISSLVVYFIDAGKWVAGSVRRCLMLVVVVKGWNSVSPGRITQLSRLTSPSTYSSWSISSSGYYKGLNSLPSYQNHFSSSPPLTSSGSCWSSTPSLTTSPFPPHLSPYTWTGPGSVWGSWEPCDWWVFPTSSSTWTFWRPPPPSGWPS